MEGVSLTWFALSADSRIFILEVLQIFIAHLLCASWYSGCLGYVRNQNTHRFLPLRGLYSSRGR